MKQTSQFFSQSYKKFGAGVLIIVVLLLTGLTVYQYFFTDKSRKSIKRPQSVVQPTPVKDADMENVVEVGGQQLAKDPKPDPLPETARQNVPKTAIMTIVPDKSAYQVGETMSAKIMMRVPTEPDGAELILIYPADMLSGVVFTPGSFGTYVKNNVYPEKGKIRVVAIRNTNQEFEAGDVELGTLTAVATKLGAVNISFDSEHTLIAANAGENILDKTQPAQFNIN